MFEKLKKLVKGQDVYVRTSNDYTIEDIKPILEGFKTVDEIRNFTNKDKRKGVIKLSNKLVRNITSSETKPKKITPSR